MNTLGICLQIRLSQQVLFHLLCVGAQNVILVLQGLAKLLWLFLAHMFLRALSTVCNTLLPRGFAMLPWVLAHQSC